MAKIQFFFAYPDPTIQCLGCAADPVVKENDLKKRIHRSQLHLGYTASVYIYISHRIHGAGIYAKIGDILMGSMLPYIAYMDPMGMYMNICIICTLW